MSPNPPPYQPKKQRDSSFLKFVLAWALAIGLAIGLQSFVFHSYQVYGQSMTPTLQDGDYLIISKVGPTWHQLLGAPYVPERGDIVVLDPSNSPRLIKRVIGLPGERVVVESGTLTVHNQQHPEGFDPYTGLDTPPTQVSGNITTDIPDDHIFVVGDNRTGSGSSDSRNQLGTIPVDDVQGSLILRLWPADSVETF